MTWPESSLTRPLVTVGVKAHTGLPAVCLMVHLILDLAIMGREVRTEGRKNFSEGWILSLAEKIVLGNVVGRTAGGLYGQHERHCRHGRLVRRIQSVANGPTIFANDHVVRRFKWILVGEDMVPGATNLASTLDRATANVDSQQDPEAPNVTAGLPAQITPDDDLGRVGHGRGVPGT